MIDLYLSGLVNTWPADLQAIGHALRLALPVLLIALAVWVIVRVLRRWIYHMETEHSAPMRTASATQIERDVEKLWQRWHDTVPPPMQQEQQQRRKVRAGQLDVPPADRTAA